ncbi:hypothetical protein [Streptomyces sp. NPDC085937]|uniref:hypothetical protein n=1 Tax=Streptomyces sp. NPDC085937 TaxID=3365742 RepID=UPI0037D47AC2
MNQFMRLAVAVLTAVVLLTACEPKTYPPGPAGTVTDRPRVYYKSGGWRYWLTVEGTKFRVTRDDWRDCVRGSSYPACTNRTDR